MQLTTSVYSWHDLPEHMYGLVNCLVGCHVHTSSKLCRTACQHRPKESGVSHELVFVTRMVPNQQIIVVNRDWSDMYDWLWILSCFGSHSLLEYPAAVKTCRFHKQAPYHLHHLGGRTWQSSGHHGPAQRSKCMHASNGLESSTPSYSVIGDKHQPLQFLYEQHRSNPSHSSFTWSWGAGQAYFWLWVLTHSHIMLDLSPGLLVKISSGVMSIYI